MCAENVAAKATAQVRRNLAISAPRLHQVTLLESEKLCNARLLSEQLDAKHSAPRRRRCPGYALRSPRILHLCPMQVLGATFLDVQSARVSGIILVNFHPATANVTSRARWHPDHVFFLFCNCACLRQRHWFQVKIQLCWLIRVGLRVHDRCLDCAINDQRDSVNTWRQTVGNVATASISLDGFEHLFAVSRFDSNICTLYRLPFCILDDASNC